MSCGGARGRTAGRPRHRAFRCAFGDADPHDWVRDLPAQYSVHGIDVSKYQGDIDWHRVRGSGVGFAFIKATEGGDHADERLQRELAGARAAGMPRGAYHYYYFCRPALEQAAWFIEPRAARPLGAAAGARPRMDAQVQHLHLPARPDDRPREALAFLQVLTVYYGKRPVIYTTVDFYRDNELWRLEGYPFWLRSVAGHPSEVYPGQRWDFWQYTGTGVVDGIDGLTDLNVFAGSRVTRCRAGPTAGDFPALRRAHRWCIGRARACFAVSGCRAGCPWSARSAGI